ncbi:hypothetical protein COV88_03070 [Candidatus Saccharibacteria bacterium CG11_big_fil_rev_8_21_14_0_20_41_19]|nr:SGNH/GDSL hydrolase family protein [Candidatus Saccharibacteria bacterium]OIP85553.1 MAG: hypothetical protein AUK57_03530 [Candidatus Saccharibacteria bacterium CG2_30_41_52]PIQ70715.1 MAG: hypothetical protein COV88_03070 [Candidatus Saccharibacteria bacterium CG11_big_fil_rev_8_21_14_0_20_41_19]PIZ59296.1 MAG: hypothetical protein COY18_03790 [Candidatus Saccharibacteria bacterium CG_4_10_14_0_2_um_filter_41_11]PJC29807.1 MAG: hypothetical protein CO052_01320 [Candidatus Saccharibacteria 
MIAKISKIRVFIAIILIGVLSFSLFNSISGVVSAETGDVDISWTNVPPTIFSATDISEMPSGICPNYYSVKKIDGYSDDKKVCMTSSEGLRFGVFYEGNGTSYPAAVGFKFDTKMYRVNGVCGQYDNCLYLPGTDTLVTKQYLINGWVRSLVVYKNFSHRLIPVITTNVVSTLQYNFDASNPDYIFKGVSDVAWAVGGIGASENGEWLAVEIRERGIGLLNINTLEMKRISPLSFYYNYGMDPTSELAASNDGKHVAVMGLNAGLNVLDVVDGCGNSATDEEVSRMGYMTNSCKLASINRESFITSFYYAVQPRFNSSGGELSFYAYPYVGKSRQVVLRASGYTRQRIDYLAMGDSFTSGEGETDDNYYVNGTNDVFEKCHLSTRSYPYLIANMSGISPEYMRSVACSAATTSDVIGKDEGYFGQSNRLSTGKMNLPMSDIILAQNQAKNNFLPGRIHQNSFAMEYKPAIITVGIGGNDAGFMEVLRTCIGLDTCDAADTDEGREKMAIEIKNTFSKLVETYKSIHIASPNTKIYAIGYPKIIDENKDCSWYNLGFLLNHAEKQFMNEGIVYLNEVISSAARAAGIEYVNIQDAYGDNVLCGSSSPSAVNAIQLGDDDALINSLNNIDWMKILGQEGFHPNSFGHIFTANTIFRETEGISNGRGCSSGEVICPDLTIVAPELSSYWLPDGYHDYPTQQVTDFVSDRLDSVDGRQKQLILEAGSLAPNSFVEVVMKSNPISLGYFEASSDGLLDVSVDLPVELEEGYHTVHLYGTSHSGELIDLYQVIEYVKPIVVPEIPQPVEDNTGGVVDVSDNTNTGTGANTDVDVVDVETKPADSSSDISDIPDIENEIPRLIINKDMSQIIRKEPKSIDAIINDIVNKQPQDIAVVIDGQEVKGVSTIASPKTLELSENSSLQNSENLFDYTKVGLIGFVAVLIITLLIKRIIKFQG